MKVEQLCLNVDEKINYEGSFKADDVLLIICFFQIKKDKVQKQLDQLSQLFPLAKITGCSGSGEIIRDEIYDDRVIINLIKFSNKTQLHQYEISFDESKVNSQDLGETVAKKISSHKAKGIIIFSDGLKVDGDGFSKGINSKLDMGYSIPIIGGLAGNGTAFLETFIISNGKVIQNKLIVIVLEGDANLAVASNGGWTRFGFEHLITKAEGSMVYEIDHRPALEFYKEYLGKDADKLPASGLFFPLNIIELSEEDRLNITEKQDVVRTLVGIDESCGALKFAGAIPVNSKIDLMRSTPKKLIESSQVNFEELEKSLIKSKKEKGNVFSLIISCVGRRLAVGQKVEEELSSFEQLLNLNIYQSGFYSYGELSTTKNLKCSLHNQTLTQAFIWENENDDDE